MSPVCFLPPAGDEPVETGLTFPNCRTAGLATLRHDDQDVRTIMLNELPHTPIPQHGLAREEVLAQLLAMKQQDQDWRGGRVFSLVYSAGDEVHELLQDALSLYSAENGLNVLAFPSIGTMQHDIVKNTATLLGADERRMHRGVPHVGWHREPPPSSEDGS